MHDLCKEPPCSLPPTSFSFFFSFHDLLEKLDQISPIHSPSTSNLVSSGPTDSPVLPTSNSFLDLDYNLLTSYLPPHDIWTAWDNTMFVTEEHLVAMENEASGQQYAPVVQDLNIASTNCAICLRAPCPSKVAGDCPPEISAEDDHPPRDVNEDQDEDRTDPSMKT
ncbi:hypothetical protein BS17DRAFT_821487 [Gyrodon lividus]|nr:hypothetical protein BS17DRAFT_821487 [Gyrodon lividus]